MKIKELIRQLQEADPSGEFDVFGDGDIFFANSLPWYWDGTPGILIRDETCDCYNIRGVKQIDNTSTGKIYLNCLSLEDLAWEHYDDEKFIVEGDEAFKVRWEQEKRKVIKELTGDTSNKPILDGKLRLNLVMEDTTMMGPWISKDCKYDKEKLADVLIEFANSLKKHVEESQKLDADHSNIN